MEKPWVVVSQISESPLIGESCPGELPDYKDTYWPLCKDQKQNKTPNQVKPLRIGGLFVITGIISYSYLCSNINGRDQSHKIEY